MHNSLPAKSAFLSTTAIAKPIRASNPGLNIVARWIQSARSSWMNASLLHMNAFQLATSMSNMSVGADHLESTLAARRSLASRLTVKAMSKYVAVLDATGEACPLASLARNN